MIKRIIVVANLIFIAFVIIMLGLTGTQYNTPNSGAEPMAVSAPMPIQGTGRPAVEVPVQSSLIPEPQPVPVPISGNTSTTASPSQISAANLLPGLLIMSTVVLVLGLLGLASRLWNYQCYSSQQPVFVNRGQS